MEHDRNLLSLEAAKGNLQLSYLVSAVVGEV